jgi:hypothetical protein
LALVGLRGVHEGGLVTQADVVLEGLPLPPLLLRLLDEGRWVHPGDDVMRAVAPFLLHPVDFFGPDRAGLIREMRRYVEQNREFAADPDMSKVFRTRSSRRLGHPVDPAWLDADLALFIAVNRFAGDDVAIALDYRPGPRPRVVACDDSAPHGMVWREITASFEEFAAAVGLG